jgi:energy-coupling factor transporter ATP-binding protein EcfA2
MELLYVWIGNYKNIKEQGFNFSPRYRFSFDYKTKTLSLDEDRSNKVIDNFFGERISNITAIVGENGSGKSNLCEFLLETYGASDNKITDKPYEGGLLVFRNKDKDSFYIHEVIQDFFDDKNIEKIKTNGFDAECIDKLNNINCVYYSQHLNRNGSLGLNGIDVSNYAKFYYNSEINDVTIFDYQRQETVTILEFFLFVNERFNLNLLKEINIPEKFSIQIVIGKVEKITDFFVNDFGEREKWDDQTNAVHNFFLKSGSSIGYMILRQIGKEENFDRIIIEIGNEILNNHIKVDVEFEDIIKLCESISCLKTELDKILYFNFENQYETTISLKMPPSDDFLTKFKDFYDNHFDILNVEWEYTLATGFNNLISFASRCYVEARRKAFGKQPLILIIDEGETGLHPNLQRQYLSIILEFFNHDFVFELEKELKIQIILATHSPFILSDLPKENVIFLKNEKGMCKVQNGLDRGKQTFAANIHTLLKDDFFLQSTIGDFATEKIDEILIFYHDLKSCDLKKSKAKIKKMKAMFQIKSKEFRYIVECVGEPYIKTVLENNLEEINKILEKYNDKS